MEHEAKIRDYLRLKDRADVIKDLQRYSKRGFRYVVRDLEGEYLVLYSLKPKKHRDFEGWGYANPCEPKVVPCEVIRNDDITEINWKNRSPVLIEDFLERAIVYHRKKLPTRRVGRCHYQQKSKN